MNQAALGRNADLGDGGSMTGLEGPGLLLVSDCHSRDDTVVLEGGKSRFSLSMAFTLAIVMLGLWFISYPLIFRKKRDKGQSETVSNARQIGLALYEFEQEYGGFPDETTAEILRQKNGNRWSLGNTSSNDYFQQLIAAGVVTSEAMFYAKTKFTKKTDPRIDASDQSLAPGEVGYGYLMDGNSALSTAGNPARPLACTPLAFDGKAVSSQTFDPSIHEGKAVILRMDNSVQSLPIDPQTHRTILGGKKHLLDTGPETVWGDSAKPVIIPPLPKR